MADAWQTYPFEFKGGLISNLSPLQHGTQAPGSARLLKNFEPSTEGGYRRIEGFTKYDSAVVPFYGTPVVQGSGQTGTTLILANIFSAPKAGDTFTIAGVTGSYVIAPLGVTYDNTNKTVTLTLTTSLASSPADRAAITFTVGSGLVSGVAAWEGSVLAFRNNSLYRSTGSGWTKINVPSYGTVLVNGAGQTGSTLAVDGLTSTPQAGDTFYLAGVAKVYTVLADATVTGGAAILSISPSLASSPADNASVTWLSANYSGSTKLRTTKYRIGNTAKILGVDGVNPPFIWDGSTFNILNSATADVIGAQFAIFHKNQMFYAKDDKLVFTAPYTDSDFSAANGSGVVSIGAPITGLIVFRDTLIIFAEKSISQLSGNTLADFSLQPITKNVGCVASDTIQEVSGDVIFLGPDGLRLLGGSDKFGDFSLGVLSKSIQKEVTELIKSSTSFSSTVIKQKSQYRLLGYSSSITAQNAKGILGTQLLGEAVGTIAWAETTGIKAYVVDAEYKDQEELIVFAHSADYVYKMEDGNSFDGSSIQASFATPYVYINDPRLRKTIYKLVVYTAPQGSVTMAVNLKMDYENTDSIQPLTITLSNTTSTAGFYGTSVARYGITRYASGLKKQFETQTIGSGFSVSLQFFSDSIDPPFSLDAATLEYSSHDRR